jgi:hypothetical protein
MEMAVAAAMIGLVTELLLLSRPSKTALVMFDYFDIIEWLLDINAPCEVTVFVDQV